jgi:hypothetical protein
MSKLRLLRAGALALALIGLAPRARAQDVEGNVLALQGNDVVVDLGTTRGLAPGDVVEVWRPLKLKHPVSGQVITDRFRIARMKIVQARPSIGIARIEGDADRPLVPGDIVVAPRREPAEPAPKPAEKEKDKEKDRDGDKKLAAPAIVTTTTTTTTATREPKTTPPLDLDAKELHELFLSLRGAPPEKRAAAYKQYVLDHPQSRHVQLLWEEANQLERLVAEVAAQAERRARTPKLVGFVPPARAPAGAPLHVAMEIAKARGAVIHVRRKGEPGFVSTPMTSAGPAYFASTISAETMKEGVVEYFVESSDDAGEVRAVAGSAEAPLSMEVEDPIPPDTRARAAVHHVVTAGAFTDYASFNAKRANDYVWQSEAVLGVRFDDVGLRALRSGFGAYRGKGGTLVDLDEKNLDGRRVGLTYGYLELEIGLTEVFAIAGRAIVGLRDEGVNGGAQGFLRFGSDRKTNLLVGGEILGGIGLRGITQLEWNAFPSFPIVLRSEVTNQPAGVSASPHAGGVGPVTTSSGQGEVGVRSIAQVGYRIVPRLTLAARGSFQARTIHHAGPGAGAAVIYEW